jgi:hypothetical protein
MVCVPVCCTGSSQDYHEYLLLNSIQLPRDGRTVWWAWRVGNPLLKDKLSPSQNTDKFSVRTECLPQIHMYLLLSQLTGRIISLGQFLLILYFPTDAPVIIYQQQTPQVNPNPRVPRDPLDERFKLPLAKLPTLGADMKWPEWRLRVLTQLRALQALPMLADAAVTPRKMG